MPVIIPETLPARRVLENEQIFVMGEQRASRQDIRPLKIAILNLMPAKITTETQLLYIVASRDHRRFYITGHSEYDPLTLQGEYDRDRQKGLPITLPRNYYPRDDPAQPPQVQWRSHAHLLFANWLNYCVYQTTPYDIRQVPAGGTYSSF